MPMSDAARELDQAAQRLREARIHLVDVMRRARAAGMSYRDISDRVGLSHETVRAMTREENT